MNRVDRVEPRIRVSLRLSACGVNKSLLVSPKIGMKAFVFKENNEFIGRFEIAGIDDIEKGFASFFASNPVKPNSYIECGGRVWTVMPGGNGSVLAEGRHRTGFIGPEKRPTSGIMIRFIEGYMAAKETIGLGNFVKGIGIAVTFIGYILAFVIARGKAEIITSILSATVTGLIIYAFGALLAAQGRILKATLDTAANTSPNLDEEDRAHLMSITLGD